VIETYEQPHTVQQTVRLSATRPKPRWQSDAYFPASRFAVGVFGVCTSIDYLHTTGLSVRQTTDAFFRIIVVAT
jgi:hypothetical protein